MLVRAILKSLVVLAVGGSLLGGIGAADEGARPEEPGTAKPGAVRPVIPPDLVPERYFTPKSPRPFAATGPEVEARIEAVLGDLPDQDEGPFAAVDACVVADMARLGTPGASIAIAVDGVITYTKGYGVKHAENGGVINAGTMFRFGSTMKMMTAAAIMQQVEKGAIDLHGPVTDYVPDFRLAYPWDPATVTPHHLLTDSSGFPDRTLELDSGTSLERWGAAQGDVWLNAPPGSFWNRSNPNYALAGLIVQEVSGTKFPEYMKRQVWRPAGMRSTTLDPQDVIRRGNYTYGHEGGAAKYAPDDYDNPYMAPARMGFTTPTELVTWTLQLSAGGGDVLSTESATAMQAAQVPTDLYPWFSYGYGIMVEEYLVVGDPSQRVTVRHHGGNTPGWSSQLYWVPEKAFAVSILGNTADPLSNAAHCALREIAGLEPVPVEGFTTEPETWDPYTGTYSMVNVLGTNWTAQVARNQDKLLLAYTDLGFLSFQLSLKQTFFDTFVIQGGQGQGGQGGETDFTFIDDPSEDGSVRWMRNRSVVGERVGEFPTTVSVTSYGCTPVEFTPTIDISALSVRAFGPVAPLTLTGLPIAQDNPRMPARAGFKYDMRLRWNAGMIIAHIKGEADDDLDMYVLFDEDYDGEFSYPREVVSVNQYTIDESSEQVVVLPGAQPAGNYRILVHGVRVAGEDSEFDLNLWAVSGGGLRLDGVPGSVERGKTYSLDVCGRGGPQVEAPLLGMVEFDYGNSPRRVNVMVEWMSDPTPRIYLPMSMAAYEPQNR